MTAQALAPDGDTDESLAALEELACRKLAEELGIIAKEEPAANGLAGAAPSKAGKGRGKGKGPSQDRAVGMRVGDLNKAGHWQPGAGIDVASLQALKVLPSSRALAILDDLEAQASEQPDPNTFIKAAVARSGKRPRAPPPPGGEDAEEDITEGGTPMSKKGRGSSDNEVAAPATRAKAAPLGPKVKAKIEALKALKLEVHKEALEALAQAEERSALLALQALMKRGKVQNTTKFILSALSQLEAKRKQAEEAKDSTVVAGSEEPASTPGVRIANQDDLGLPTAASWTERDMSFEAACVPQKLHALNSQGIWEGAEPINKTALDALMKLDPAQALELLDEVESQGAAIAKPSAYIQKRVKKELLQREKATPD